MSDYNRPGAERVDASSAHTSRAMSTVADDAHTILINKVSWGAIFAGVVVQLVFVDRIVPMRRQV